MNRAVAALCTALAGWCVAPAQAQQTAPGTAPTRVQVQAEADALRSDADMPGKMKQRTLRFKEFKESEKVDKPKTPDREVPDASWARDFALWVGEAGRFVVWVVGAIAVALLLVSLRRIIRMRAGRLPKLGDAPLPSHVRELDIRPQSLPEQVGEAARKLWLRGEHREALSLLYRGALSRLVHAHAVPISASSTEGECVALAARRLSPERSAFFASLVDVWRLAVYGQRLPDTDHVVQLCDDFDRHFSAPPPAPERPVGQQQGATP